MRRSEQPLRADHPVHVRGDAARRRDNDDDPGEPDAVRELRLQHGHALRHARELRTLPQVQTARAEPGPLHRRSGTNVQLSVIVNQQIFIYVHLHGSVAK